MSQRFLRAGQTGPPPLSISRSSPPSFISAAQDRPGCSRAAAFPRRRRALRRPGRCSLSCSDQRDETGVPALRRLRVGSAGSSLRGRLMTAETPCLAPQEIEHTFHSAGNGAAGACCRLGGASLVGGVEAIGRSRPGSQSLNLTIARRSIRDKRVKQLVRGFGHLVNRPAECDLVCFRGSREAAQLPDELQGRGKDFLIRGRRLEIVQSFDVSTHNKSSSR